MIAASVLSAVGTGLALGSGASGRSPAPTRTVVETTATAAGSGRAVDASGVAAATSAGVVTVHSTLPEGAATGSGFVVKANGEIVTNDHVVDNASRVTVSFGSSSDAKRIPATIVGTDASEDLALIKIDPSAAGGTLHPLSLGASAPVKVGQSVVAIGSPLGYDATVTSGIVSAKDRTISSPNGFSISGALQTDTAINPGNSGGPLLDSAGRVIGVNSQIATNSQSEQNIGIGFAIGVDVLKADLSGLESGKVRHAWLGVATATATRGGRSGAVVESVNGGGPAQSAGLATRDLILALGGHAVTSSESLQTQVLAHQPGDKVDVVVVRNGARRTESVTLGNRPQTTGDAQQNQQSPLP